MILPLKLRNRATYKSFWEMNSNNFSLETIVWKQVTSNITRNCTWNFNTESIYTRCDCVLTARLMSLFVIMRQNWPIETQLW